MQQGIRGLALVAVVVTVVLWASAFVGVRFAGQEFPPGALALGRMLAGSVVLSAIVGVRALPGGRTRLPRGRALAGAAAWGVAWFALYNLALNTTEHHLDAGTTALLVNVAPIVVAVLAGLLLGEGFPRRLLAGLAIAFSGIVLIAATTWTGRGDVLGVLLGLASALLYAVGATAQKRLLAHADPLTLTWIGALAGTAVLLPFAPQLAGTLAVAPASATAAVLALGVLPTGVAFLTWGYALSRTTAGRLASTTYAVPPIAVLLSWVLLGEAPAALTLVGGAVSLLGVAVATGLLRLPRTPFESRFQPLRRG